MTIGDVRFLTDGGGQTCDLATGACEDDIQEQRVSDTGVTSGFWAASPAQSLRIALSRATGPTSASTQTVAGQPATCVTVPSGRGDETTCATPAGILARWDTAAVDVEADQLRPDRRRHRLPDDAVGPPPLSSVGPAGLEQAADRVDDEAGERRRPRCR